MSQQSSIAEPQRGHRVSLDDSNALCVEYRNRATLIGGGVYTSDDIAVFSFEDGLIREYDYFDPRRFQIVVDALRK